MGELCPRPEHYSILFSCTQYLDWTEQTAGQRLGVELDYLREDLFEYVHQSEREVPWTFQLLHVVSSDEWLTFMLILIFRYLKMY